MFCINKKLLLVISLSLFFLSTVLFLNKNKISYKTSAAGIKAPLMMQGGSNANYGEYPYMVALYDKSRFDKIPGNITYALFCGGVLINPQWVLTANHCLETIDVNGKRVPNIDVSNIGVAIGIINLKTDYNDKKVTNKYFLNAKKIITNKDYVIFKSIHIENDTALIKLDSAVPDTIKPVEIAYFATKPKSTFQFLNTTIVGWGFASTEAIYPSEKLQDAVLSKVYFNSFRRSYLYSLLQDNPTSNLKLQPLSGDSGGPLLYVQDKVNKLLGIIHGGPNGRNMYVYAPDKKDWIDKSIKDN